MSAVGAVDGFYDLVAIGTQARERDGLTPSAPLWPAIAQSYERWLRLLTVGSRPWLAIAVVCGLRAGFLGCRWAVHRHRTGVVAVGVVLVAEPLLCATGISPRLGLGARYSLTMPNVTVWTVEALLGLIVLAFAASRSPSAAAATAEADAPRSHADAAAS